MFKDISEIRIFVKPGVTDMRKAINGLAGIIANEIGGNQFSGDLYIFCNKNRKVIKIIYWDRNGFCLWQKRLEKDRFPWPADGRQIWEVSLNELKMLLEGIDFFHAHQELKIVK